MTDVRFTRFDFLKGALAAAGFAVSRNGRVFAAPSVRDARKPNLTFGVLADTHFRTDSHWRLGRKSDRYFVAALEYFRSCGIDALVLCGDMADRGLVDELQFHADAWHRVFPGNKAPDGRTVEKLFVTGNHDIFGWGRNMDLGRFVRDRSQWPSKYLRFDIARHWERIWGEKYESVWSKRVKGYRFFGMHWGGDESALLHLLREESKAPDFSAGGKPFFFISHNMLGGGFRSGVRSYPNGFGLWGHWHQSAANWNTIRMLDGAVPGIQCPACPSWWRPDGRFMGGGDDSVSKVPIEGKLLGGKWYQGLVVRVYDDMVAIERREFSQGGSLGPDWIMPLEVGNAQAQGRKHPFSREELRKRIGTPAFRSGERLEIAECLDGSGRQTFKVGIPLADANEDSRVYAYDVFVSCGGERKMHKAVYAAGCNMGTGRRINGGKTELFIAKNELPQSGTLTFSAVPLTSLGTSGGMLSASVSL